MTSPLFIFIIFLFYIFIFIVYVKWCDNIQHILKYNSYYYNFTYILAYIYHNFKIHIYTSPHLLIYIFIITKYILHTKIITYLYNHYTTNLPSNKYIITILSLLLPTSLYIYKVSQTPKMCVKFYLIYCYNFITHYNVISNYHILFSYYLLSFCIVMLAYNKTITYIRCRFCYKLNNTIFSYG